MKARDRIEELESWKAELLLELAGLRRRFARTEMEVGGGSAERTGGEGLGVVERHVTGPERGDGGHGLGLGLHKGQLLV